LNELYCEYSVLFSNSSSLESGTSEETCQLCSINVRLVYTAQEIGKSSAAGEMCGIMNLLKLPTEFGKNNNEDITQDNMKNVVEEAVRENKNECNLTVALVGSWLEGDTHLNGVVTATSGDTDKVADESVLFKH